MHVMHLHILSIISWNQLCDFDLLLVSPEAFVCETDNGLQCLEKWYCAHKVPLYQLFMSYHGYICLWNRQQPSVPRKVILCTQSTHVPTVYELSWLQILQTDWLTHSFTSHWCTVVYLHDSLGVVNFTHHLAWCNFYIICYDVNLHHE